MRISRTDQSLLAHWWFSVDRVLLGAILLLAAIGMLVSLAASPAVAEAKHLPRFYFVQRHAVFAVAGVVIMLALSLASPRRIRLIALAGFTVAIACMVLVLFNGTEINGARRWLRVGGLSLQPSELAKPCFVVLTAWAFAQSQLRRDVPALPLAIGLLVVMVGLLALQPDVGQTLLVGLVWGALLVLAGLSVAWILGLVALGGGGLAVAYATLPYVRLRILKFWSPTPGDNSQTDRALQSFIEGGFLGRGPGEGTIKTVLPDAHTDFIFAVIGEEYGVVACLGVVALFLFIVVRAVLRALDEDDLGVRYGAIGLALLIGFQAFINMGVNVGLLPAKGMTLPMISAGGSSTLAIAVTFGMLIALTRSRPGRQRLKMPRLPVTPVSTGGMGRSSA